MIKRISDYTVDVELKTNLTSVKLKDRYYSEILDRNNAFIEKQVFGAVCVATNTIESQIKLSLIRATNRYLRTTIKVS